MSAISPLSPTYASLIAPRAARTEQASTDTKDGPATTAVKAAQQQSAEADAEEARIAKLNAAGNADLEKHGVHVSVVSFAGLFKDQILKAVDTDHDNTVSQAELSTQVLAGAGTQAQADALFKAMDMDGDGTVTGKEFKDSIPNPFATAAYQAKLDALMADRRAGKSDGASLMDLFHVEGQDADPAYILGKLAQDFPKSA